MGLLDNLQNIGGGAVSGGLDAIKAAGEQTLSDAIGGGGTGKPATTPTAGVNVTPGTQASPVASSPGLKTVTIPLFGTVSITVAAVIAVGAGIGLWWYFKGKK